MSRKKYDLVLVHGLANRHKWGDAFLNTGLDIWGSGRVFVIYTNKDSSVTSRELPGGTVLFSGGSGEDAGIGTIALQAEYLADAIAELSKSHGLQKPFSIIAHSMGGLVARKYISAHPETVSGLVTLGTPHHGSPLADSFRWAGYFVNAVDAIESLKPSSVNRFNDKNPVRNMIMADPGKMFTVRGDADGNDAFGWAGELLIGWQILSVVHKTDSDGLVPRNSALIDGAIHIADFPDYDHYDLVLQPEVIIKASEYLP